MVPKGISFEEGVTDNLSLYFYWGGAIKAIPAAFTTQWDRCSVSLLNGLANGRCGFVLAVEQLELKREHRRSR
jgi:hypothetical protein